MTSSSAPKDKFFEKVVNPYLAEVLQHPQTIEMCEGVLHIRDVEGPRKTGSTTEGSRHWSKKFSSVRRWWSVDSIPITS